MVHGRQSTTNKHRFTANQLHSPAFLPRFSRIHYAICHEPAMAPRHLPYPRTPFPAHCAMDYGLWTMDYSPDHRPWTILTIFIQWKC